MPRGFRSMIVVLSSSVALFAATAAVAQPPVAQTAGSCGVGSGHGFGYTYLTSLSVRGTGCSTGKSVAKHHGKVHGWRCSKKRLATSPVQYDERETCTSGGRHVQWNYTENT
jgi:hypothetical protein